MNNACQWCQEGVQSVFIAVEFEYTFFLKQLVYKQPQAQIAKYLSTLHSAWDLVSKVTLLKRFSLVAKP